MAKAVIGRDYNDLVEGCVVKDKHLFSTARKITSAVIMTCNDQKLVSGSECAKKNIFSFSQKTILPCIKLPFDVSDDAL